MGKIAKILLIFLVILITAFLVGCQNQLKILKTYPEKDAVDVKVNDTIKIWFSTGIDAKYKSDNSVYLQEVLPPDVDAPKEEVKQDQKETAATPETATQDPKKETMVKQEEQLKLGKKLVGTIQFSGEVEKEPNELTVYLDEILKPSTYYQVTVSGTLQNTKSSKLGSDITFQFQTAPEEQIDFTIEYLNVRDAKDGIYKDGYSQDTPIVVVFNKPVSLDKVKSSVLVWERTSAPYGTDSSEDKTEESTPQTNTGMYGYSSTLGRSLVKFTPYLVETEKNRFTKYIFVHEDGRYSYSGSHEIKVEIDKIPLMQMLSFDVKEGLSQIIAPQGYIDKNKGEFIHKPKIEMPSTRTTTID